MTVQGSRPTGFEASGSVAVRTFEARRAETVHEPRITHAMASPYEDELPDGQFYDPDAEYEPDPEYAATLAPDAARQRRERVGPTGRPLPYFPIPGPLAEHGPAQIVAMCNQKGGVGKTTSTINLGAALAEYGRRVLLVDFDPQGALSVGLGVNPMELDLTVYNLLMERGMTADEVLLKTAVPGMDLLPSNIDLSAAEVQLVSEVARESTLAAGAQAAAARLRLHHHRLPALAGPADRQRADRGAQGDRAAGVRVLRAARRRAAHRDHREGPRAAQPGAANSTASWPRCTTRGPCTAARCSPGSSRRSTSHVFHTVIGRTVRFPETTVAGEPITTYASNSVGAAAYRQLAREVLARCHAE